MISTSSTIKAHCDLKYPRAGVFAHWTSPISRARWETGSDTNLKQLNYAMEKGGVEVTEILHEGQAVGKMTQSVHEFIDGELLATTTTYSVQGEITMMAQLVMEMEDIDGGCRVTVIAQVADLTGKNITEQHKSGWAWIFSRFEADIEKNGLVTG